MTAGRIWADARSPWFIHIPATGTSMLRGELEMRKLAVGLAAVFLSASAHAAVTTSFNYTQSSNTTGSGTIAGFTYDPGDGGGAITFGPTAMPAANVVNPSPALTTAGNVGAITATAAS